MKFEIWAWNTNVYAPQILLGDFWNLPRSSGQAKRKKIVAGQQFLDKTDVDEIFFDVDSVVLTI